MQFWGENFKPSDYTIASQPTAHASVCQTFI